MSKLIRNVNYDRLVEVIETNMRIKHTKLSIIDNRIVFDTGIIKYILVETDIKHYIHSVIKCLVNVIQKEYNLVLTKYSHELIDHPYMIKIKMIIYSIIDINKIYLTTGIDSVNIDTMMLGYSDVVNDYIDLPMFSLIDFLNKRGYYTLYCCSGHLNDKQLYILFEYKSETIEMLYEILPELYDMSDIYVDVCLNTFEGTRRVMLNMHYKDTPTVKTIKDVNCKLYNIFSTVYKDKNE